MDLIQALVIGLAADRSTLLSPDAMWSKASKPASPSRERRGDEDWADAKETGEPTR
jgi:hypothetical protein